MGRLRLISRDFGNPQARKLEYYRAHGGYQAALKALDEMAPKRITEEVIKSNLRGLGGAGFPVGGSGVSFLPTRANPSTWWSTPTRESRGPSRTATSWSGTPTGSWKG